MLHSDVEMFLLLLRAIIVHISWDRYLLDVTDAFNMISFVMYITRRLPSHSGVARVYLLLDCGTADVRFRRALSWKARYLRLGSNLSPLDYEFCIQTTDPSSISYINIRPKRHVL